MDGMLVAFGLLCIVTIITNLLLNLFSPIAATRSHQILPPHLSPTEVVADGATAPLGAVESAAERELVAVGR